MRAAATVTPASMRGTTRYRMGRRLALCLLAVLLACETEPAAKLASNVLIVTVDTLRADYLGVYGDQRTRTPRIDELGRGGVVFENAVAPMPLTRPSHSSLMTSRHPREHGVLNNRIDLPDSALTLAEIFSSQGYQTGAFVSVVLLDEESGIGQGFDAHHHPTVPRETEAHKTVTEALNWLSALDSTRPFFLWVHLFEPHLPYAPKGGPGRAVDETLHARFPSLNWKDLYQIARENDGDVPAPVLEYAQELYRSEIEVADRWVGELLDGLDENGLQSNTLTVLTADHGEPFENGIYFEHADSLFDGAIRVPLILNYPPQFPAGKRVAAQVSLLDVAPSILEATGIEVPENYSGKALQHAESHPDRYVLIQHPLYQQEFTADRPARRAVIKSVAGLPLDTVPTDVENVGIVGSEWKFIRAGNSPAQLYARAKPHAADEKIIDAQQPLRERLDSELSRRLDEMPVELINPGQINPELLDNLKALGYAE